MRELNVFFHLLSEESNLISLRINSAALVSL